MKNAAPSRPISWKPTENLELLIVVDSFAWCCIPSNFNIGIQVMLTTLSYKSQNTYTDSWVPLAHVFKTTQKPYEWRVTMVTQILKSMCVTLVVNSCTTQKFENFLFLLGNFSPAISNEHLWNICKSYFHLEAVWKSVADQLSCFEIRVVVKKRTQKNHPGFF